MTGYASGEFFESGNVYTRNVNCNEDVEDTMWALIGDTDTNFDMSCEIHNALMCGSTHEILIIKSKRVNRGLLRESASVRSWEGERATAH
ncbi:hypothetical protein Zmor_009328 [Zophobas morio]|uniref:Uncharacterized protein n=1 Tax=Zophobas morio TaxID=2755281 RepID=A0AA38MIL7_9CUCU|nr:hypothetical protein Zmor_009328 [Zophobas morio]